MAFVRCDFILALSNGFQFVLTGVWIFVHMCVRVCVRVRVRVIVSVFHV